MGIFGRIPDLSRQGPGGSYGTPGFGDGVNERRMATPAADPAQVGMLGSIGRVEQKRGAGDFLKDFILNFAASQGNPVGMAHLEERQQGAQTKLRERMAELQAEREERKWIKQQEYQRANPSPHRWEANDGSLMEYGQTGVRQVYKDPTPKINWIQVKDPTTGELRIIPVGPQGPMGGQAPQSGLPPTLTDDDWGPGPGGPGTFP